MKVETYDVIVAGGGAAGLLCAIEAGKRGRRVLLLERQSQLGRKILISGGGRCNFTNLYCQPENFLSANPHFAKAALSRYSPQDFIALVEKHRIAYHEKKLGQLFCDGSAREIVDLLQRECERAKVTILTATQIESVERGSEFCVHTNRGEFHAASLVIATGGLSIPKIGATPWGYQIAEQFGLQIRRCRPALVPLTLNPEDRAAYCDLAGVSCEVIARAGHAEFREKMLITHRGLSGPAVLQISSYWEDGQPVVLDLAPGQQVFTPWKQGQAHRDLSLAKAALQPHLPARLAERWLQKHAPSGWTNAALDQMESELHGWRIFPAGTEGYEKAEVTAGGVDTSELSAKTMECREVPGLFFIGEVVDVTGQLGGFNFQWAWASGFCAGQAV